MLYKNVFTLKFSLSIWNIFCPTHFWIQFLFLTLNQVHGLMYVVDASDVSRLTENRITFGELISNEHISGKPLLLLANKQDLNGAVDELDLVENLNVECVANAMRCPTRVEICSCFDISSRFNGTRGIINGYKWLLDTILQNYNALNSRARDPHNDSSGFVRKSMILTETPSKLSVYSDPFKPIHEMISKQKCTTSPFNSHREISGGRSCTRFFPTCKNKTAPIFLEHDKSQSQITLNRTECDVTIFNAQGRKYSDQTTAITLGLSSLELEQTARKLKLHRPFTAPQSFRETFAQTRIFDISGQEPQYYKCS